jgi:hypothetical protein
MYLLCLFGNSSGSEFSFSQAADNPSRFLVVFQHSASTMLVEFVLGLVLMGF